MKKKILLLLETIIIFSSTGCGNTSTVKYINRKLNMDIYGCNIVANCDEHGGFHGDGDYYVELEFLDNSKNIIKQLYSWNELPLSENLQLIMYGGEKDGITYGYELLKKEEFQK